MATVAGAISHFRHFGPLGAEQQACERAHWQVGPVRPSPALDAPSPATRHRPPSGTQSRCFGYGTAAGNADGRRLRQGLLHIDASDRLRNLTCAMRPIRYLRLAAVADAIVDALSEFGIEHIELPATPNRVWRAIRSSRRQP